MPEHKDVARTHRFDLINSKLELPLDDIARHIEVYQGVSQDQEYSPEIQDKVSLSKLHEEMIYDNGDINADLEYLVVEGFLEKDIVSKGNVVYSMTQEAETYYDEIREWTSEYLEGMEQTIGNGVM
jgi:predicted DNA-binding transcriptional regulator